MFDEQLIVVGTGIRAVGQLTTETIAWIKAADKVLYVVSDPVAEELFKTLNPQGAESLMPHYGENRPRAETYAEIVETALGYVRAGRRVCVAVYGHPGVFATPMHVMVRKAREEGYKARMLPAISAEDCLFADLGIDPSVGCQSFEATDFLRTIRQIEPSAHLILWQIGGLGDHTYKRHVYDIKGMEQLVGKLMRYYSPNHHVYLYEAPLFPGVEPLICPGPLQLLPHSSPTPNATLYVPPAIAPFPDHITSQWLR